MKPKIKGRSSNSSEDTAPCYDFTKFKEALHLAHNFRVNNFAVDNSTSMQNKSTTSCIYDFSKVGEALAMMDNEAFGALSLNQNKVEFSKSIKKDSGNEEVGIDDLNLSQRLVIGRGRISRTKRREDAALKVKSEHDKILKKMKTKRRKDAFLMTLKSLKKCS